MRTIATIVLGALATIALWLFFALNGVMSYATDAGAVTTTARNSDLHGWVLGAADAALTAETSAALPRNASLRDTAYRQLVLGQTREAFAEAFPQDWLYHAFATAYGDILAIVEGNGSGVTSIDLRSQKAQLDVRLKAVAGRMEDHCAHLFGLERCANPAARRRAVQPLRRAMASTLAEIPDQIDIAKVMTKARKNWLQPDSPRLQQARQALGLARTARYVAAAVLVLVLVVLALVHAPGTRAVMVVGTVLVIAGASYLAAVHIADSVPERMLSEHHVRERMATDVRDDAVGDVATRGAETLALAVVDDAMHASDAAVLVVVIASLGAATGAAFLRRRR